MNFIYENISCAYFVLLSFATITYFYNLQPHLPNKKLVSNPKIMTPKPAKHDTPIKSKSK